MASPGDKQEVDPLKQFIQENTTSNDAGTLCLICKIWITTRRGLTRHIQESHLEAEFEYYCSKCHKPYKRKRTFVRHVCSVHPELKDINLDVFKRKKELIE